MLTLFNRKPRRILVARPDRIGDVVLSTPVYHTLKTSFPGSFVGALVSSYTSPLLVGNPNVDVIIHEDSRNGSPQDFWKQVAKIRSFRFDTALLLLPTSRLGYMLFLAGIPDRVGVGHILYEVITMMRGVSRRKYNPLRHESEYMLDLAKKIGAEKIWPTPELFLSPDEKEWGRRFLESKNLDADKPVVAIHPGSGKSAPNWTPGSYRRLAEMLSGEGIQILVVGSKDEKAMADEFSFPQSRKVVPSFGEMSLRELMAALSRVSLLVSSSTGPMHIAAALGTRTCSMFCPLTACSPALWGPRGNSSKIVMPPEDFCSRKCPGDPHVCTFGEGDGGITVREVFEAGMEIVGESEAVSNGRSSG